MKRLFRIEKELCDMIGVKEISSELNTFYEGKKTEVIVNGKSLMRRVYNEKAGLYIFIKGYKVYYHDFVHGVYSLQIKGVNHD